MDTKLKGDIAEQAVIFHALKRGHEALIPVGDRLPYDLVLDVEKTLFKIQVKCAWFDERKHNYVVDTRRTKTNRRTIKRDSYQTNDFDFAFVYIIELDLFYIFPSRVFNRYASEIHMVESNKRQRKPRSAKFRDAWELLTQNSHCNRAAHEETHAANPVKFGEASSNGNPEPSLN